MHFLCGMMTGNQAERVERENEILRNGESGREMRWREKMAWVIKQVNVGLDLTSGLNQHMLFWDIATQPNQHIDIFGQD